MPKAGECVGQPRGREIVDNDLFHRFEHLELPPRPVFSPEYDYGLERRAVGARACGLCDEDYRLFIKRKAATGHRLYAFDSISLLGIVPGGPETVRA
jgi:hypothetical protein